jgi:hypothetical protein
MDVPGEHFRMPTLARATQRDVARPEQASQPLALRQGATCHSLQCREAEARVAPIELPSKSPRDTHRTSRG